MANRPRPIASLDPTQDMMRMAQKLRMERAKSQARENRRFLRLIQEIPYKLSLSTLPVTPGEGINKVKIHLPSEKLELVISTDQALRPQVVTALLYKLSKTGCGIEGLGCYLSIFENIAPRGIIHAEMNTALQDYGYEIQMINLEGGIQYLHWLTTWGASSVMIQHWASGSSLSQPRLEVGIAMYALILGQGLGSLNYSKWVTQKSKALLASIGGQPEANFWSEGKFAEQAICAAITAKLSMQPIRRLVFTCFRGIAQSASPFHRAMNTAIHFLRYAEMTHIQHIREYLLTKHPQLLSWGPLYAKRHSLRAALKFLDQLTPDDLPFARILLPQEDCRVLQRANLEEFAVAALAIAKVDNPTLGNYAGKSLYGIYYEIDQSVTRMVLQNRSKMPPSSQDADSR